MHVLIIDNDTKQRNAVEEYLDVENYDISSSMDWKEGKEIVEDSKDVNIIIAAFDMPDFSGKDFIEDIQSLKLDKKPYVIFLVDEKNILDAVDCFGTLLGDYILKPLSPEGLRARIAVTKQSIALREKLDRVKRDSESLTLYDQLTGVLNRQAVYDQALAEISRAQREARPLSVAMIELSNLQQIETKHGNEVRDQALRYVSSAVRANVRIYDILGRWIGAKFLLMLPNTNLNEASIVVGRVSQSIATIGIELPDHSRLRVDVKFGVSSIPPEETIPLYMLVEQANSALLS
ncbi:MAG: diguanylate cyclase, partial [Chloroflexota bacterium]